MTYFNPRSPHGERLWGIRRAFCLQTISIHAPRTGSDGRASKGARFFCNFNPRSPHGERHGLIWVQGEAGAFQSTLPARGATVSNGREHGLFIISIHAPRTGSDATCGERFAWMQKISIHAPRTGSDEHAGMMRVSGWKFQSTLPARGATREARGSRPNRQDFNPRSPHGERPHLTA